MTIATFIETKTSILIDGPAGKLEIVLTEPTDANRKAWAIICHPHPLFGGSMQNKVVTTLAKTLQHLGLTTVRFNFRGVQKSEGQFDHGEGELADLLAVMHWMEKKVAAQPIWLAGFSFGAYVAAKAATVVPIQQLITVAPPVQHFPMQALPPILCPWILIQGELDDIVSPEEVFTWALARKPPPTILRFPQAGHFFHGQLSELRTRLAAALLV